MWGLVAPVLWRASISGFAGAAACEGRVGKVTRGGWCHFPLLESAIFRLIASDAVTDLLTIPPRSSRCADPLAELCGLPRMECRSAGLSARICRPGVGGDVRLRRRTGPAAGGQCRHVGCRCLSPDPSGGERTPA